jgi:hypothetical protein
MRNRRSAENRVSNDPPVTIATFMFLYQAQIAQGALKDAGIGSFIPEGNTVGMAPHYANAVGGVRLQVRESDAQAARAVLNDTSYEAVAEFETDEDAVGIAGGVDRSADPWSSGSRAPDPERGLLTGRPGFLWMALAGFVVLLGIGLFFLGRGSQTTPEAPEPCEVAWKAKNWDDTLAWCSELTQARPQSFLGWVYLSQAMTERGLHGEAVVAAALRGVRRGIGGGPARAEGYGQVHALQRRCARGNHAVLNVAPGWIPSSSNVYAAGRRDSTSSMSNPRNARTRVKVLRVMLPFKGDSNRW